MFITRNILLISIMNTFSPLPNDTWVTSVNRDYAGYDNSVPGDAAQLIESVRISDVTAIYYRCAPHYRMDERRIGDDMFYYVARGKGEINVEGRTQQVHSGDCAHFRRGELHAAFADARDPFEVIVVHYTAMVFGSLSLPHLLNFPDLFSLGEKSPFEEMLFIACREYALHPVGWERGLEALVLRMLLFLMRNQGEKMNAEFGSSRRRELERVLPALEHLRKHLIEPLCVGDLARVCHLSEPQFRRVFRAALGVSPAEYSRRLRMEEAATLLRRTDETIEAISARVGYADPSFFAHTFKAMMGLPPGKYRVRGGV